MVNVVRPNLYYLLENMDQARSILRKLNIPEDNLQFKELKKFLLDHNKLGRIGTYTKWMFQDNIPLDQIIEVENTIEKSHNKIPDIGTFNSPDEVLDYIRNSETSSIINQVISKIPSNTRKDVVTDDLKKLIKDNIEYAKQIKSFYSKKGGAFKTPNEIYNITISFIKNLKEGFNHNLIIDKINKINKEYEKNMAEVVYTDSNLLIARIYNYTASKELGSPSWCISYSKESWDKYVGNKNAQYFIWDFSKDKNNDPNFLIGVTIGPEGKITAANDYKNMQVDNEYIENLIK